MKKSILLLLPCLLAACSSVEVQGSAPGTVVVEAENKEAGDAQAAANRECGKQGKVAKLNQTVSVSKSKSNFFFDCQ
jgi:hypothetical protein